MRARSDRRESHADRLIHLSGRRMHKAAAEIAILMEFSTASTGLCFVPAHNCPTRRERNSLSEETRELLLTSDAARGVSRAFLFLAFVVTLLHVAMQVWGVKKYRRASRHPLDDICRYGRVTKTFFLTVFLANRFVCRFNCVYHEFIES